MAVAEKGRRGATGIGALSVVIWHGGEIGSRSGADNFDISFVTFVTSVWPFPHFRRQNGTPTL
jgi:hypothetical protein